MADITIAIVEDEEELRENLQDLLEFKGYTVKAYTNAEDMLADFDSLDAKLVLMDFQLPGMTGIEALPLLKEKKPQTPVALVTASSQQNTREEAEKSGIDRIVLKPYSPQDIFTAVEEMLSQ